MSVRLEDRTKYVDVTSSVPFKFPKLWFYWHYREWDTIKRHRRDGKSVTMATMKYLNKFSGLHLKSEKLSKDCVLEATIWWKLLF